MDDAVQKPKSKTNQKLKKAPTRPIVTEITPTGPVKEGFEIFKANPVPFVVGVVSAGLISIALQRLGGMLGPLSLITSALGMVVSAFFGANLMKMALAAHDRRAVALTDLTQVPASFVNYLATSFIVGIGIMIGLFLLVIPGFVAMALLAPALALVVDKNMDPVSAVQRSVEMTRPHLKEVALVMLVIAVMNMLGGLLAGLGLLVTAPVSLLAMVCVYRSLDH